VPRKMDLNWFIPALVNSRVGSDRGATGEEGTNTKGLQVSSCRVFGGGWRGKGKKTERESRGSTHQKYGHFVGNNLETFVGHVERSIPNL
jgi:hypothetical protein